jgi:hypothetical protein
VGAEELATERGSDVERLLCAAIEGFHLVQFVLSGRERIAEPHDLGVIDGRRRLFFYQIGGSSRSGQPLGWRWADVDQIVALQILERRFAGSRPAPSGRHQRWDRIIASVSRPPGDDTERF